MRKSIALLMAATLLLTSGCTSNQATGEDKTDIPAAGETNTPISLDMLHFYTEEEAKVNMETKAYIDSIATYQQNHPEINVNIETMAHDDYGVKIQARAAANDLPDIFILKGSWIENFASNGLVADLTQYRDSVEWADDFYPGVFDSCTYDEKIYGVPNQFCAPTSMVFYDAELWKQAGYESFPQTWEEVQKAAAEFQAQGINTTIALGNKEKWPYESCWFSTLADRYTGTEWMNAIKSRDGSAKFTDPDFVSALAFTRDLGSSGILNPDYNSITSQQANDLYIQGKAAAVISGNWDISYILANATEELSGRTKIAALPQPAGATKGEQGSMSSSSGWFVAINSKLEGEKLEAALDFAFGIAGPEFSRRNAELQGGLSPVKVDVDFSKFPELRQEYVRLAQVVPQAPVYDVVLPGNIVDVLNAGMQEVMAGTKTPEALAAEVQAEYEAS